MSRIENTKRTVNDIILVFVVLLLVLIPYFFKENGDTVKITVCGEVYGEFSLSESREIDLGFAKVVIKNNSVSVSEVDCPDKICQNTGEISLKGDVIICVPNKLVVEINGGEADVYI